MRHVTCLACLVLASIWFIGCEGEQGSAGMEKAKEAGAGAHSQSVTEANSLLDQANGSIQKGKLDQAQEAVDKLQSMKSSLPESMQKKIDAASQSLTKAKAAQANPASLIPQKAPAKK